MNFLEDKKLLRELLKQGDLMNTVNGGVRETKFKIESDGKDLIVQLSNPSISPEAFNFTIQGNELYINVMHIEKHLNSQNNTMYPLFFKVIRIPYFVEINKIEASYEQGKFKVLMPYNNSLPDKPYRINIRNLDN